MDSDGDVVAWVDEVARLHTAFDSLAGHSMPCRTKEAATSSIKPSMGAPRNAAENVRKLSRSGPASAAKIVGASLKLARLRDESPRGCLANQTGEVTAMFHPLRRDDFREGADAAVTSTPSSPLGFVAPGLLKEV